MILFVNSFIPAHAQETDAERIKSWVTQSEIEFNIYFLASDEFLGRDTGTQELDIASRYIATWFQIYGVDMVEGADSYFQNVPLQSLKSPEEITFEFADSTFIKNRELILLNNFRGEISGPVIFLDHATKDELDEHDVEGKIVITNAGIPGQTTPQEFFVESGEKRSRVTEAGATGLIELYTSPQFPWQFLVNFLSTDRLTLMPDDEPVASSLPHLWMNGATDNLITHINEHLGETGSFHITGPESSQVFSRNVVGVIRGTDPELKDEFLLLGAHYDHTGVRPDHPEPITSEFIYNGARDNAVGTAGILAAARYLAKHPPKRSVIFAAWTAEEQGLLGSQYFAENPMIPLNQIIYKLNIDGAGYNDTTKVTVIGLGRTEADDDLKAAAEAFGLTAIPDPVPEQNLFNRSDNVHFARHGIPAPTYSLGITAFDDEINYYYHQPTDEPHSLDYGYITQYIRSFVLASLKIANAETAPFWLPGDVYESAGRELYQIE